MLLLTPVIWIWSMAAMVVAVRQVLDYSETFKAVVVVLIGFVVYLVFWGTIAVPDVRRGAGWRRVRTLSVTAGDVQRS